MKKTLLQMLDIIIPAFQADCDQLQHASFLLQLALISLHYFEPKTEPALSADKNLGPKPDTVLGDAGDVFDYVRPNSPLTQAVLHCTSSVSGPFQLSQSQLICLVL